MIKQFKINPDLTCHELAGYKLPPVERHPIAIEVEMLNYGFAGYHPAKNPDVTVKGRWVYE